MTLRPYRPEDLPRIAALFYETVHTVCAKDYTKAQLDAWATGDIDERAWNESFLAHTTLVAEERDELLGFADMTADGYLDRLYVKHSHLRRGVATALLTALESACPAQEYTAHVSLTARPFFERRGYRVVKEQQVERKGVLLTNFVMKKAPL